MFLCIYQSNFKLSAQVDLFKSFGIPFGRQIFYLRWSEAVFHLFTSGFLILDPSRASCLCWVKLIYNNCCRFTAVHFLDLSGTLSYPNSLGVQMVEGGIAEKFPDEWDIQLLGNTITNQLASGIPPDFLIKRQVFSILFDFIDRILLLKFQTYLIHKISC